MVTVVQAPTAVLENGGVVEVVDGNDFKEASTFKRGDSDATTLRQMDTVSDFTEDENGETTDPAVDEDQAEEQHIELSLEEWMSELARECPENFIEESESCVLHCEEYEVDESKFDELPVPYMRREGRVVDHVEFKLRLPSVLRSIKSTNSLTSQGSQDAHHMLKKYEPMTSELSLETDEFDSKYKLKTSWNHLLSEDEFELDSLPSDFVVSALGKLQRFQFELDSTVEHVLISDNIEVDEDKYDELPVPYVRRDGRLVYELRRPAPPAAAAAAEEEREAAEASAFSDDTADWDNGAGGAYLGYAEEDEGAEGGEHLSPDFI